MRSDRKEQANATAKLTDVVESAGATRYNKMMRRRCLVTMLGFLAVVMTTGCVGPGNVRMAFGVPKRVSPGETLLLDVNAVVGDRSVVLPRQRTYMVTIMGPNNLRRKCERPIVVGCGMQYSSGVANYWWLLPLSVLDVADALNRFERIEAGETFDVSMRVGLGATWRRQSGLLWHDDPINWPPGEYTIRVAMMKATGNINTVKLPPPLGWSLPTVAAERKFTIATNDTAAMAAASP